MSEYKIGLCNFVSKINCDEIPTDDVYENLFDQYERVVIQSLVTSFGLDFLIKDQHGGDVDTIINVRKIGSDPEINYKNGENAQTYSNRGEYDYNEYHDKNSVFSTTKSNKKEDFRNSNFEAFQDEYTNGNLYFTGKNTQNPQIQASLDHVVECKHIHDDRGRVLAGIDGAELANCEENYAWTNKSLNSSMGAWSRGVNDSYRREHGCDAPMEMTDIKAYINAHPELDEEAKTRMLSKYEKARSAYETKLARVYYTSGKFWKNTSIASAKLGLKMGLRQVLGLIFTEMWFCVKDAVAKAKGDGENMFNAIAEAVKKGLINAKNKFKELWDKFIEGAVAGALSSLVTTLANIFFTTAKNTVKIIRETWASLTQASKILFVNPDGYLLGDRMVAAAKILATGASVVAGSMVHEALGKTVLSSLEVFGHEIGDTVKTFVSSFVTGIMSCSMLYLLDHDPLIKQASEWLNNLPSIEKFIDDLKKQGEIFSRYLAELMQIDFEELEKKERLFVKSAMELENANNDAELNVIIHGIYKNLKMDLPWKGYDSLDAFMNDKDSRLVFS